MLEDVRKLGAYLSGRHMIIESITFRLCCRLTSICLLIGLFIISTKIFVSEPIFCDLPKGKVNKDLLNQHCYLHGTYRIVRWYYLEDTPEARQARYNASNIAGDDGVLEPWPGIRPLIPGGRDDRGFTKTYRIEYTYFNWLLVMYFVMAVGFFIPNYLWKCLEGGRLKVLISKIDFFDPKKDIKLFARYMNHSFGNYRFYMLRYFACEALAIGNIILQMYLLNRVLHGRWYDYGVEVFSLYWTSKYNPRLVNVDANPMVMLFPKQTKCEYRRFGPSGNLDIIDALCMMPLNNFNDKFFLLFWFWCALLMGLFALDITWRLIQYSCRYLRYRCLKSMLDYEVDTKHIFKRDLRRLVYSIELADWFVLYHMGANVDSVYFYEALAAVIERRFYYSSSVMLVDDDRQLKSKKVTFIGSKHEAMAPWLMVRPKQPNGPSTSKATKQLEEEKVDKDKDTVKVQIDVEEEMEDDAGQIEDQDPDQVEDDEVEEDAGQIENQNQDQVEDDEVEEDAGQIENQDQDQVEDDEVEVIPEAAPVAATADDEEAGDEEAEQEPMLAV